MTLFFCLRGGKESVYVEAPWSAHLSARLCQIGSFDLGTVLGRISIGEKIANCTFGGPGNSVLYMTADMHVCRIATKTSGFCPFIPANQNQ